MDHILFLTQQGDQKGEELIKGEEVHSEEEDEDEEIEKTVS